MHIGRFDLETSGQSNECFERARDPRLAVNAAVPQVTVPSGCFVTMERLQVPQFDQEDGFELRRVPAVQVSQGVAVGSDDPAAQKVAVTELHGQQVRRFQG